MNGYQYLSLLFGLAYGVQYSSFVHTLIGAVIGGMLAYVIDEFVWPRVNSATEKGSKGDSK